jgi:hypothetical protein
MFNILFEKKFIYIYYIKIYNDLYPILWENKNLINLYSRLFFLFNYFGKKKI